MKQNNSEDNSYFDTQAVKTAQPVVPLAAKPAENTVSDGRIYVPVQTENKRFSPIGLGLILVLAVGAFAGIGAFIYRSAANEQVLDDAPAAQASVVLSDEGKAKQAPVVSKNIAEAPKKNPALKPALRETNTEPENIPADEEFFDISEEEFEQRRQDAFDKRSEKRKWEKQQRKIRRAERLGRDYPEFYDEF